MLLRERLADNENIIHNLERDIVSLQIKINGDLSDDKVEVENVEGSGFGKDKGKGV